MSDESHPGEWLRQKNYLGRYYTADEVEAMIEEALWETCIVIKNQNFEHTAKRMVKRYEKATPRWLKRS